MLYWGNKLFQQVIGLADHLLHQQQTWLKFLNSKLFQPFSNEIVYQNSTMSTNPNQLKTVDPNRTWPNGYQLCQMKMVGKVFH